MTVGFVYELMTAVSGDDDPCALHLFDGPHLSRGGQRHDLPEGGKRLVAFLALSGRQARRRSAACELWPSVSETRAVGNLRSALWRLRGAGLDVIEADKDSIRLAEDVIIDLELLLDWAARLIGGTATARDLGCGAWRSRCPELLPGWYEEWVLLERERLRCLYLHGLEAMSHLLIVDGRYAEAVETVMAVTAVDPLRESAQRLLVEAHLAEGNVSEAVQCYRRYRLLIRRELRVDPSPKLAALLDPRSLRRSSGPHSGVCAVGSSIR